jgi:peptide-methionine (S)-S-oxide reductase
MVTKDRACFGAGCYWGTERYLYHVFGKKDTTGAISDANVGFMGPDDAPVDPTYAEVKGGYTKHVEVFEFEYTGGLAYYEALVRFFFQFHDPTTLKRQGNDVGTQYASVIYCYNDAQAEVCRKVKAELQLLLDAGKITCFEGKNVTTDIRTATVFYPAHKEHQDYLTVNPDGYCNHRIRFPEWPKLDRACFGAGCYWGTERYFYHDFGKKNTSVGKIFDGAVGFMGPEDAPVRPSYAEVKRGQTKHVEVYEFAYSGDLVYYEALVRFFFQMHDPTTPLGQGEDIGTQYASVIFCYTEAQADIARRVKAELQALLDAGKITCFENKTVATDIRTATVFYPAHKEHQDYLTVNPDGYCNHRIRFPEWPKLEAAADSSE